LSPLDDLRDALEGATTDLRGSNPPPKARPSLERPPRADFGDYSSNAAMLLAPLLGEKPRDVAERLGEAVAARLADKLARVDVAGPGFLNLFLSDAWYGDALAGVLAAGTSFGGGATAVAERVDVEFVSANPTGPIHLGHARNAAYGDAICRLLAFHGHEVHREFYANDAGAQVTKFAEAIQMRARGEEPEEYLGEYVSDLAAQIEHADTMPLDELAQAGMKLVEAGMRETLERYRVAPFDTWFSERSLYEGDPSPVQQVIDELTAAGATYHAEDALWLRSTDYGDDKDRVLVKSDGTYTYQAPDTAYHQDKRRRGFDRLIDVWGADHHGYVLRTKAAFVALGGDPDQLELLIMQLVNLVRGGQPVSMSKRSGDFVTLDELIDEIGTDAARWFLLARSHDTTIEVDLDLAKKESSDNPVYYVQYAHARIAGILRSATSEPGAVPAIALEPAERALIKRLVGFPGEVAEASDRRAPHRIATFALELARDFAKFYETCHVRGSDNEAFRLAICAATRDVIARSLDLLGIEAPESM
jgi:arginyl-tRNA synthetase